MSLTRMAGSVISGFRSHEHRVKLSMRSPIPFRSQSRGRFGQDAKRHDPDWHTDIRSDLGPASKEGQRQNQRNCCRREALQYFNSLLVMVWGTIPSRESVLARAGLRATAEAAAGNAGPLY